jgi:predicted metal-binding membrane protein
MVMVSAMMLPLSIPTIRLAAARSLWIRRHRAILVFLLAFFLVWLVFGAAAVFVQYTMARLTGVNRWGTAAFLVAAVWEFAPAKPRAITACERSIPLAPRGWRADRDCVRYGGRIAAYCIVSCWPRMLAMIAAPSVSTMAVVTLMGVADRRTSQPKVWWNALILVALGARALAAPG